MLLVVTTKCDMGCSHCMVDSKPQGEDISWENFKKALNEIARIDDFIILTGGEPFQHPNIMGMIEYILRHTKLVCLVTTNGKNLSKYELALQMLLKLDNYGYIPRLQIQITHDSRYYPQQIDMAVVERLQTFPQVMYIERISSMSVLGRAKKNNLKPHTRTAPMCCNVIMVGNQTKNLGETVAALTAAQKLCHFTVMSNLDVMICECRQMVISSLKNPDWKKEVWRKLQVENQHGDSNMFCNACEFGNYDMFSLAVLMKGGSEISSGHRKGIAI